MINEKRAQIIQKTTIDQAIEKMLGGIGKPHTCIPNFIFKKSDVLKRENPSYSQNSVDPLRSSRGRPAAPYKKAIP